MLGRLQLISTLLLTLGVVTSGSQGFVLEDLMRFLNAAFTSAKVEVCPITDRDQALGRTVTLVPTIAEVSYSSHRRALLQYFKTSPLRL